MKIYMHIFDALFQKFFYINNFIQVYSNLQIIYVIRYSSLFSVVSLPSVKAM